MADAIPKNKWLPLIYEDREYKVRVVHGNWWTRFTSNFGNIYLQIKPTAGGEVLQERISIGGDFNPYFRREIHQRDFRQAILSVFEEKKKREIEKDKLNNPPTFVLNCTDDNLLSLHSKTIDLNED